MKVVHHPYISPISLWYLCRVPECNWDSSDPHWSRRNDQPLLPQPSPSAVLLHLEASGASPHWIFIPRNSYIHVICLALKVYTMHDDALDKTEVVWLISDPQHVSRRGSDVSELHPLTERPDSVWIRLVEDQWDHVSDRTFSQSVIMTKRELRVWSVVVILQILRPLRESHNRLPHSREKRRGGVSLQLSQLRAAFQRHLQQFQHQPAWEQCCPQMTVAVITIWWQYIPKTNVYLHIIFITYRIFSL